MEVKFNVLQLKFSESSRSARIIQNKICWRFLELNFEKLLFRIMITPIRYLDARSAKMQNDKIIFQCTVFHKRFAHLKAAKQLICSYLSTRRTPFPSSYFIAIINL